MFLPVSSRGGCAMEPRAQLITDALTPWTQALWMVLKSGLLQHPSIEQRVKRRGRVESSKLWNENLLCSPKGSKHDPDVRHAHPVAGRQRKHIPHPAAGAESCGGGALTSGLLLQRKGLQGWGRGRESKGHPPLPVLVSAL